MYPASFISSHESSSGLVCSSSCTCNLVPPVTLVHPAFHPPLLPPPHPLFYIAPPLFYPSILILYPSHSLYLSLSFFLFISFPPFYCAREFDLPLPLLRHPLCAASLAPLVLSHLLSALLGLLMTGGVGRGETNCAIPPSKRNDDSCVDSRDRS